MASNVEVRFTAETTDLQTKLAIARQELAASTRELNNLAKQATQSGPPTAQFAAQMEAASTKVLGLKTSVASLTGELKSVTGGVSSSVSAVQGLGSAFGAVRGAAGALGVALSLGELKNLAVDVARNSAELQHEADVLQLNVVSLQAFHQAAIDSGVGTDAVDTALQRFSKNAAEAAVGTGTAVKAFIDMNLSANQSKEALVQQVSAFMLHTDAVTRDRLSFELFSRTGNEMIPLYEKWAQGPVNLAAKYDALGRIIDPGITKAQEAANNELAGSWEQFKVAAAGPVSDLTKGLTGLLDAANGAPASADHWREFGREVGVALLSAVDPALELGRALDGVKKITPPKIEPPPKPIPLTEKEEVLALAQYNEKIRERAQLTAGLAFAQKTINDAKAANDLHGLNLALETQLDLQKKLDAINKAPKTKFGGGFANAGAEEIAQAREAASEIQADESKSNAERYAEIEALYRKVLESTKLNAAQRIQVNDELNRTIAAANQAARADEIAIVRSNTDTELSLEKIAFAQKKAMLEQEVADGRISGAEKIAALRELVIAEGQADEDAVTMSEAWMRVGTAAFIEAENHKLIIHAETAAKLAELDRDAAADAAMYWKKADQEIFQAEDQLVAGLFNTNQRFTTSLLNLAENLVQKQLAIELKYLTQSFILKQTGQAQDRELEGESILFHIFGESQMTGATAVGEASRLAIKQAAKSAGSAIELASGSAQILNDASKAAAGAYSAVAGIPIIGPILAPIAATTAYGAVVAFDTLTSFDKGTNFVPADMIVQIHKGERVIPAADNAVLTSIVKSSGVPGSGDVHLHYAPTNTVLPPTDVIALLNSQKREFIAYVNARIRDGSLRIPTS